METTRKKEIIVILSLSLMLCGCFGRSTLMTRSNFQSVELGEPVSSVEKRSGNPYAVRPLKDGSYEYEYVEKIWMGGEVIEVNHYYIVIKDDKVISKHMNRKKPPAFDEIYDPDPNDNDLQ